MWGKLRDGCQFGCEVGIGLSKLCAEVELGFDFVHRFLGSPTDIKMYNKQGKKKGGYLRYSTGFELLSIFGIQNIVRVL